MRHGEKAADGGKDPSLAERGQTRAKAIGAMFANAGVTKIVATTYKRTQETLAPLSERTGIPIESMRPERMREAIENAPDGSLVVAASHSNVIPRLVEELANTKLHGVEGELLAEDDYSRVIVIARPCRPSNAIVTELTSSVE